MAEEKIINRLKRIMRNDAGINGDAQCAEQMAWLIFLKVYDALEKEWEFKQESFKSIIPEKYRWRNWATALNIDDSLTGDKLLWFVNNELFPALKNLSVEQSGSRSQQFVKEVFSGLNQYMKDGLLLRQVINVIDEIDFSDAESRYSFCVIYESILKDLLSASDAGEFYTPRVLTDFIVKMLDPRLGERMGDFSSGTGGFLTSTLSHLERQCRTYQDTLQLQESVRGQEIKTLPYLLSITNLLLHGVESPKIIHGDSLGRSISSFNPEEMVDVIAMNPPFGGKVPETVRSLYPLDVRSSDATDLFIALIMRRLKTHGRAAVIIPNRFLCSTEGAKLNLKTTLLREFNLHTIIRLPVGVFAPYTGIATNIIFFNNEEAGGHSEKFRTKDVWFYRLDLPDGNKLFSKTHPMKIEHCQPIMDWWNDRKELKDAEGNDKARCFSAEDLVSMNCNFDQCKFPANELLISKPPKRDIFVSYSRKDHDAVMDIKRQIDSATGTECWIDLKGIESGSEQFIKDITDGIDNCKVFLFMLSKESQQSEYALLELNYAKMNNKRVVLVNIDDCMMKGVFLFKYSLTDTIAWNNQLQRDKLIRDLCKWIGTKRP